MRTAKELFQELQGQDPNSRERTTGWRPGSR